MTEQQWLTSADSEAMMQFLLPHHPSYWVGGQLTGFVVSDRKLRCFGSACCQRYGVEKDLDPERDRIGSELNWARAWASHTVLQSNGEVYNYRTGGTDPDIRADFLRDIFGNPFRPLMHWRRVTELSKKHQRTVKRVCGEEHEMVQQSGINPDLLSWNDGTVPRIARGIYDDRAWGNLGVLYDALLDAGCDDEFLLSHVGGLKLVPDEEMPNKYRWHKLDGPHVRGCWVLDLILGL